MSKSKGPRVFITLECAACRFNPEKRSFGISRYLTSKNRRTTPEKLEILKHCRYCNKHTAHREIK